MDSAERPGTGAGASSGTGRGSGSGASGGSGGAAGRSRGMGAEGVGTAAAATNPDDCDGDTGDADCPPTHTTPEGGFGLPDRYGLAAAARAAAMISREIAYADPDPLALSEIDERLYRYATTLLSASHTDLLGPVIGDWRRVTAALGRRLSPAVHCELTRAAGYLSFCLGYLAADTGDDTSARRFATLAAQYADHLDDRLLAGTAHSLDAFVAFADGRLDAARAAAARAAAVRHPALHGWAAAQQVQIAAATGDEPALEAALFALRDRPSVPALRTPGWPPFDEAREACVVADAMWRLRVPGARSAARRAVALTTPDTLERGWALGSLAATLVHDDPAATGAALDEMVAILDLRPSRVLAGRVHEILLLISAPPLTGTPRPTGLG
ncbi:hypothetical protein MXD59_16130 [Frankia sp. Ag45/Mut15]|uniref:Uncharacterized protein n=1 Tax=Frankia umida TaxID=573489 RepID=A0ABT0K173_9ACTN|nr:hypothetical protein [Frankia umida]MCK9877284.1 hypothetical protein [Frankia umida]